MNSNDVNSIINNLCDKLGTTAIIHPMAVLVYATAHSGHHR